MAGTRIERASDALRNFAHHHGELNRSVAALAARIGASRASGTTSGGLARPLEELRESLFLHFAHEEEGLFPFVAELRADLARTVNEMILAHDEICGALARVCALVSVDRPISSIVPIFERFERAYVVHAARENLLLVTLEKKIGAGERRRLAEVVAAL